MLGRQTLGELRHRHRFDAEFFTCESCGRCIRTDDWMEQVPFRCWVVTRAVIYVEEEMPLARIVYALGEVHARPCCKLPSGERPRGIAGEDRVIRVWDGHTGQLLDPEQWEDSGHDLLEALRDNYGERDVTNETVLRTRLAAIRAGVQ